MSLARTRPNGPSVTQYLLTSPSSACSVSFLLQLVSSMPAAATSADVKPPISCDGRGGGLTVVSQDHDVEASVEADLLQAVHQLAHDPVDVLDGQNQLQDRTVIWTSGGLLLPPGGSLRTVTLFSWAVTL